MMARLSAALLAALSLAACAAPPDGVSAAGARPVQVAAATSSDPALLNQFFGPAGERTIAAAIRCPIRCQTVAR